MPKSINLGNGSLLVGLDHQGQVRDFYFHYPGLENHVGDNFVHRIGIFVDGTFSWISGGDWKVEVKAQEDTMCSNITAVSSNLGISLEFHDVVYNEKNIFLREISILNNFDRSRSLKLFINQEFNISETHIGDTAYFDPRDEVIVHYKGRRVFLINTFKNGKSGFDEYSIGLIGIEGQVGTWMDAEDGELTGNPIEHGQVDSVVGLKIELTPRESTTIYYWICAAKSLENAKQLNEELLSRNPHEVVTTTSNFWKAWVNVQNYDFKDLGVDPIKLFKRSLLYMRTHTANNGAIIASGDSEMLQFGRDYYRYVWPRDGSFAAVAYAKAGDFNSAKRFFQFCRDIITSEGYFMHKYRPDKALGSSWHPWIQGVKAQFPIQEDETALVVWGLWQYYEASRDIEFIEELYNAVIRKASDFMCNYLDDKTGLPKSSYDLWEQVYGISTFTSAAVYGALISAAKFASLLGKTEAENKYSAVAANIKSAILKYLYDEEGGYFYKLVNTSANVGKVDKTIDISSVYGIYKFGVLPADDKKVEKAFKITMDRLDVKTDVKGYARYEGDTYHFKGGNYPGNPWIVTTLWVAQYLIDTSKKEKDLVKAKEIIEWVNNFAGTAGTLAEQLDPYNGEHLSASPLIWSHAEYITTVRNYMVKKEEFEKELTK